jgi:hypothetical protein
MLKMICKDQNHNSLINNVMKDIRYDVGDLLRLFENPASQANRKDYINYTHEIIDSLQLKLKDFIKQTDIDTIEDIEQHLN